MFVSSIHGQLRPSLYTALWPNIQGIFMQVRKNKQSFTSQIDVSMLAPEQGLR